MKTFSLKEIMQDEVFSNTFSNNRESTIESKAAAIRSLCNITAKSPTELIKEALEDQFNPNMPLPSMRRVNSYISQLYAGLNDLAPSTKVHRISVIRYFYELNEIQLPPKKRNSKTLPIQNPKAFPSADDIKRALTFTKNPRNHAIILCQASSGMGAGEVLSITTNDFWNGQDKSTNITTLHPIRKKTQHRHITFISPEATDAVKIYLEEYDGEMLFPLTVRGLKTMYSRLDATSGFQKEMGEYGWIRSHNMRKFFNDQMRDAGMPVDLVDYLSGRTESTTRTAYHTWKEEVLKESYSKYVGSVSILETVRVVTNEEMMKKINELLAQNLQQDYEMKQYAEEMDTVKKIVAASSLYENAKVTGNFKLMKLIEDKLLNSIN